MFKHLPNAITLVNLLSGSTATVLLFRGQYDAVLLLAGVSLVADVLDGLLARTLKAQSVYGAQLDSLADLIAFGVLPGCIIIELWTDACQANRHVMAFLGLLIPAASALRLARYNIDTRDRQTFYGLPTPSSAMVVFGVLLIVWQSHPWAEVISCNGAVFIGLVVLLPVLLLSNLRFWSLKGFAAKNGQYILAVMSLAAVVCFVFFQAAGLLAFMGLYVISALLNRVLKIY